MESKTISILGCGWLGFPLAQRFIQSGYTVKGSTTTPGKISLFKKQGIAAFVIESTPLLKGEGLDDFFDADILFLNIPFKRSLPDPEFYRKQIVQVIEKVKPSPIQRVIFASSTSVYPDTINIAKEDESFLPDNPRAAVLYEIEQELLRSQTFKTTVIRFAGLYGGSRQIGKFLAGKKHVPDGDGPVNLIHLEDCVSLVVEIIAKEQYGIIFNACSDEHPTRKELYSLAAKRMGLSPPEFSREPAQKTKIVSNEKIKQTLRYTFKHPNPLDFCV